MHFVKQDLFLWYQKVEALCNNSVTLAFDVAHDWKRTHEIATTSPVALYYTTKEVDEKIAQALGLKTLRGKGRETFFSAMSKVTSLGHVEAFTAMLEWGCERDKFQQGVLESFVSVAFANNRVQILQLPRILRAIEEADMSDYDAVDGTLECNDIAGVSPITADFFLSHCPPINQSVIGSCAYHWIKWGYDRLVRVLLKRGLLHPWRIRSCENYGELDENGNFDWSPLCLAAKLGRAELVKAFLLSPGGEEDSNKLNVLREAVEFGHVETVRVLLEQFLPLPKHLSCAVEYGRTEVVKLLLTHSSCLPVTEQHLSSTVADDRTEMSLLLLPLVALSCEKRAELIILARYNENAMLEKALLGR